MYVCVLQFSKRDKLPTNIQFQVTLSKFVITGVIWNDSEVIVQIRVLGLHVQKGSCAFRQNPRLTQPTIQWKLVPICREVKRPETVNDHTLPSNAKVKNEWSYTSIPPHYFIACTQTTLTLPQTYRQHVINFHSRMKLQRRHKTPVTLVQISTL